MKNFRADTNEELYQEGETFTPDHKCFRLESREFDSHFDNQIRINIILLSFNFILFIHNIILPMKCCPRKYEKYCHK